MTQDLAAPTETWQRADGIELLGPVQGSGLDHTTYLVRRPDGQVVQVSELLNLVLARAAEPVGDAELARRVSDDFGRELDTDGLRVLAGKLEPLGLLVRPGGEAPVRPPTAAPLLALRGKATIFPRSAVDRLSRLLRPLYAPAAIVVALCGLAALDIRLFLAADAADALTHVLMTPGMLLALYALMTMGALFHEIGHATACRYGGARPGVIGFGFYLIFPAFYTDVTDAYRLPRAGRIRTDLGGLYFHVLWVLGAGVAYLFTGSPLLLLLVIVTQLQMAQQLPPTIRLDGYFVLADLAGVPDLFSRVGPVLRSLVPGRPVDPRVSELRPATRRIVTAWVLVVVPFLAGVLVWLAWSLPFILRQAYVAGSAHVGNLATAISEGHPLLAIFSAVSLVMLAIPALGVVLVLANVLRKIAMALAGRLAARASRPQPRHAIAPAGSRHLIPPINQTTYQERR